MPLTGPPPVSRPDRLLLAILRDSTYPAGLPELVAQNWPVLRRAAHGHDVQSLLAYSLGGRASPLHSSLPSQVLADCADILHKTHLLNMLMGDRLSTIGRGLTERGIGTVVLKGMSLLRTCYPDPGLRVSRDIDLLVDRQRVDEAVGILADLGYRSRLSMDQRAHYAARHFHYPLLRNGMVVELHWDLVRPDSPYSLHGAGVLRRGRILPGSNGLRYETHEDQLLHAAAQSLSEGFVGLKRVCDVHFLISPDPDAVDWEAIAARARDGRLAPTLALLLRLDERLLHGRVPSGARLLQAPRSVFVGIEPLRPGAAVMTSYTCRKRGFGQLLRFWLLPGARLTVLRHMVFGHPRDRTLPGAAPRTGRPLLVLKRLGVLAGLVVLQALAMLARRRDRRLEVTPASSGSGGVVRREPPAAAGPVNP